MAARSSHQKQAIRIVLSAIAVAAIALTFILLAWMTIGWATGTLTGERWPARGLLLLMDYSPDKLVGKSFLYLVTLGAGYFGRSDVNKPVFYTTMAIGVTAILLCILLAVVLRDPDVARPIFNYSPVDSITTMEAYTAGLALVFAPLGAWLAGTLASVLGQSGETPAAPAPPPTAPSDAQPRGQLE